MNSVLLFSLNPTSRANTHKSLKRSGYRVDLGESLGHVQELGEQYGYDALVAEVDDSIELFHKVLSVRDETLPEAVLIIIADRKIVSNLAPKAHEHEFDVLEKPYSVERLKLNLERALEARRLRYEAQSLRHERHLIHQTHGFVAVSPATKNVLALARKVAKSDSTALLTGETGTGKELVAGAIHYESARAGGPFVKVNCAALPAQLLESELFGHEKGAFTSADRLRIGRFEQANTGTIFFDEVGDMSLETQAKVLRVVQEREFQRLGSSRTIHTDVRLIAATNKPLGDMVEAGEFREDLFYRLNVISIEIPPLRERREDILPLVDFFSLKFAGDLKKPHKEFSSEAVMALLGYSWPGNIRELQNVVERGVLLSDGPTITVSDLGLPPMRQGPDSSEKSREPAVKLPAGGVDLKEVERSLVLQALERSNWVQKEAAKLLGVSTRVLNHKIRTFGITHPRWRRNV